MKQITRTLLAVSMLLSMVQLSAASTSSSSNPVTGLSYFLPRAQNGTAVDILGWAPFVNKYDADAMYFDFKVQSEYRQSFHSNKLAEYLTFNGTNTMNWGPANITGTTTGATATTINSINFLLPQGFQANVTFAPKIQSSITDFSLYVGFDEWVSGLWLTAHLPLVYTRWNTHITEESVTAAPAFYANGEVSQNTTTATAYTTVTQAYVGDKTAGDANVAWSYGRINGAQSETKLGDVALNLGYNFINKENGYLGIAVRGLFGAGGHSKAHYVFEPTVGYGGRSGVGGFLQGYARLWERDEDHNLSMYLSGYAVHLFNGTERRSFDLTNSGTGSRYNLVKKLNVLAANSTFSNIDNMINIGSQRAKININVVYEVVLQLTYQRGNFGFDLGYSGGGRGSEHFSSWVDTIPANTYVLYGNAVANDATGNQNLSLTSVLVNGNQSAGGTATAVTTANESTYCISNDGTNSLNQASALAPSVYSTCIFGDINYTWKDNDWQPNVSLYANVEFGGSNKTANTWGIGLQGNVSY